MGWARGQVRQARVAAKDRPGAHRCRMIVDRSGLSIGDGGRRATGNVGQVARRAGSGRCERLVGGLGPF